MIKNLAISIFVFSAFGGAAYGAWVSAPGTPVACPDASNPGCATPINISGNLQTKNGSLSVMKTDGTAALAGFGRFFARAVGLGPGFFDGSYDSGDLYSGSGDKPVLLVDGLLGFDCLELFGTSDCPTNPNYILQSDAAGLGLGTWSNFGNQFSPWAKTDANLASPNDIYNIVGVNSSGSVGIATGDDPTNSLPATLTVNGSIAKYDTIPSTVGNDTQINLSDGGETGGQYSTVGGGKDNKALANHTTVSGGGNNVTDSLSLYSTIGGGGSNTVGGEYAVVFGGESNTAGSIKDADTGETSGRYSSIGGGKGNAVADGTIAGAGDFSSVAGGQNNKVFRNYSVVGGGINNKIGSGGGSSGSHAAILGGEGNSVDADYSIIPGGKDNAISSNNNSSYSFAGGQNMRLQNSPGTFVWGNSATPVSVTGAPNSFFIHPSAGPTEGYVGIGTPAPTAKLDINGTLRIRGNLASPPALDKILVSTGNDGSALWADRSSANQSPGGSVMYIRAQFGTTPPDCPTGWINPITANGTRSEWSGANRNTVRTCYRDQNYQVMSLRVRGSEVPPDCPSAAAYGWLGLPAASGASYLTEYSGSAINRVRICYRPT